MQHTIRIRSLWRMGTALAFLAAVPAVSQGQEAESSNANALKMMEQRVSLNVESARLTQAIKLLMSAVDANYTIDNDLRAGVVTAHLKSVPLRVALEALMKASSLPTTYRVENDIFSFTTRTEAMPTWEEAAAPPAQDDAQKPRVATIQLMFTDPAEFVPYLGGTIIRVNYQNYGVMGGNNNAAGRGQGNNRGATNGNNGGAPGSSLFGNGAGGSGTNLIGNFFGSMPGGSPGR